MKMTNRTNTHSLLLSHTPLTALTPLTPPAWALMLVCGVAAMLSPAASAQSVLRDQGNLRRDLSVQSANTPKRRQDFRDEVRLRNDVVTGNAVGGRSFRGSVGYKSGDEFRGALGSDDLFSFRRDSLGSGAAGQGLRGTNSLQYQFSYSTGNRFGSTTPQSLSTLGGSTIQNKTQPVFAQRTPPRIDSSSFSGLGQGWNSLGPKMGTLRSTSSFNSTLGLSPAVIGQRQTREGLESLTASGLLGLRSVQPRRSDIGFANSNAPVGLQRPIDNAASNEVTSQGSPERTNTEVKTAYTELLDRAEKSQANKAPSVAPAGQDPSEKTDEDKLLPDKPGELTAWEKRIMELREQLEKARQEQAQFEAQEEAQAKEELKKAQEEAVKRGENPLTVRIQKPASKQTPRPNALVMDFDDETIRLIRELGVDTGQYVITSVDRDLYSDYMSQGAKALAAGKYFDAEEQFSRCLAIIPGDPTASAARINAQIGAALFLSAAVNAQALFDKHPEVMAVRYTGQTMPSPKRMATVAEILTERIDKARQGSQPVPSDAAFLVAYIGFQINDAKLLDFGFKAMEESQQESPDPLLPLLRKVWVLGAQQTPATPAVPVEPAAPAAPKQ